jgi:HSP20 family protein
MFPTNRFEQLRQEMENIFEDINGGGLANTIARRASVYPMLNIWDEGERLGVEAEIPGVRSEDLEIFAVGNELTIKGSRPAAQGENVAFHRRERAIGEFTRVVTLPVEVDAEGIEAVLKDGILTLHLPKAASARPRQITVKTN